MQPFFTRNEPEPDERVVDPSEIVSRGVFFQPRADTVRLSGWSPHNASVLCSARKSELKTDNIHSLAVTPSLFNGMKKEFLAFDGELFGGLEELILLAEEDEKVSTTLDGAYALTKAREVMKDDLERRKRESPEIVLPVVRVMTEKMFKEWWGRRSSIKGLHGYIEDI
jgi:hypothetical protein